MRESGDELGGGNMSGGKYWLSGPIGTAKTTSIQSITEFINEEYAFEQILEIYFVESHVLLHYPTDVNTISRSTNI